MEAVCQVGAVASIVQIAQLGAQLSITLYKIAETVGSANKDVQYVAKDIALFSAVLKDLGKTLERGQKSRLYRDAAYESSRLIVKECEEVFREIESILNKSTKDSGSLDTNVSLPRIQKFMWVFRKSRVHLLRGNLESLKSTILLQVAVLSYADKVSTSINEVDAADELLALKSLVLAEDTAKREFQELVNKRIPSSDYRNKPVSNSFDAPHGSQVSNQHDSTTSQNPFISTMAMPNYQSPNHSYFEPQMLNKVSLSSPDATNKYAQIWPVLDRLELALKKLEVARWQHDRIQDNLQLGPKHYAEYYYRGLEANFLQRLERDLTSFGLSKERVEQAIASLKMHDAGVGLRAQVKHTISKDDALLQTLQSLGASWEYDQHNPSHWTVRRWMPEYFEDILWDHTHKLLSPVYPQTPATQNQYLNHCAVEKERPALDMYHSKSELPRFNVSISPQRHVQDIQQNTHPHWRLQQDALRKQDSGQEVVPAYSNLQQNQQSSTSRFPPPQLSIRQSNAERSVPTPIDVQPQRYSAPHGKETSRELPSIAQSSPTYSGPYSSTSSSHTSLQGYQEQMHHTKGQQNPQVQKKSIQVNIPTLRIPNMPQNGATGNHALLDYEKQLMLLEQQNKKGLAVRPDEQPMTDQSEYPPGISPQGKRSGPSPNPQNQMKRDSPKVGQELTGSPMPDGDMPENRGSPATMNFNGMSGGMPPEIFQPQSSIDVAFGEMDKADVPDQSCFESYSSRSIPQYDYESLRSPDDAMRFLTYRKADSQPQRKESPFQNSIQAGQAGQAEQQLGSRSIQNSHQLGQSSSLSAVAPRPQYMSTESQVNSNEQSIRAQDQVQQNIVAQTPTSQSYPSEVRPQLPPIGYTAAGSQVPTQYPAGIQMYQQSIGYSGYPQSSSNTLNRPLSGRSRNRSKSSNLMPSLTSPPSTSKKVQGSLVDERKPAENDVIPGKKRKISSENDASNATSDTMTTVTRSQNGACNKATDDFHMPQKFDPQYSSTASRAMPMFSSTSGLNFQYSTAVNAAPGLSIHPQPPATALAPINPNGQDQLSPRERPRKKRGRPSKAEHEQRARETEAPISMLDVPPITGDHQEMDATMAKVDELIKRWTFVERGLG